MSISTAWNSAKSHVPKGIKSMPQAPGFGGFAVGAGIDALMGLKDGKGIGQSVFEGALWGAAYAAVPGLWAMQMAPLVPAATQAVIKQQKKMSSRYVAARDPNNMNFSYEDNRAAYTMRQAAVQAIQGSKLNARSALGGEARMMHRGIPSGR